MHCAPCEVTSVQAPQDKSRLIRLHRRLSPPVSPNTQWVLPTLVIWIYIDPGVWVAHIRNIREQDLDLKPERKRGSTPIRKLYISPQREKEESPNTRYNMLHHIYQVEYISSLCSVHMQGEWAAISLNKKTSWSCPSLPGSGRYQQSPWNSLPPWALRAWKKVNGRQQVIR